MCSPLILPEVSATFNDKSLGQQAEVVGRLVFPGQLLQSHPGAHSLGVPVATLHIVHLGHHQQSLVQIPGLEDKRKWREVKQQKRGDLYQKRPVIGATVASALPLCG